MEHASILPRNLVSILVPMTPLKKAPIPLVPPFKVSGRHKRSPNPSSGATSRTVTPGGTPPKASGDAANAPKNVPNHVGDVAKSRADEQKNDVAPVTSSSTANKNSGDHGGEQKKRTFGPGKNFSSSKKPKVQGENSSQAPSGPTSALPPTATWASKHRSGISGSKEDREQK
ncbi:hypothetical protein CGCA056_v012582 [Colletotrichum aenigma]|uniref:uncharacterized protein n=1 Tax=Colletotrichum aenigma TaxID=1215731 RepID=UPI001872EA46|nr:uncharacterized protein CGCA056_v012582 [Colletotrichum aenigma]KAF5512451.1 hypothetical protein CGCA056_v012582 [Colletotrichum aenigma]